MHKVDIIYHHGGWLDDYVRFMRNRKSVRKQRTFCYCPTCNHDLCSNNSLHSDTDRVRYICTNCGTRSEWDFDSFAPILLKSVAESEANEQAIN